MANNLAKTSRIEVKTLCSFNTCRVVSVDSFNISSIDDHGYVPIVASSGNCNKSSNVSIAFDLAGYVRLVIRPPW